MGRHKWYRLQENYLWWRFNQKPSGLYTLRNQTVLGLLSLRASKFPEFDEMKKGKAVPTIFKNPWNDSDNSRQMIPFSEFALPFFRQSVTHRNVDVLAIMSVITIMLYVRERTIQQMMSSGKNTLLDNMNSKNTFSLLSN